MRRIIIDLPLNGVIPVITIERLNSFEAMGLVGLAAALLKDKVIAEAYDEQVIPEKIAAVK